MIHIFTILVAVLLIINLLSEQTKLCIHLRLILMSIDIMVLVCGLDFGLIIKKLHVREEVRQIMFGVQI